MKNNPNHLNEHQPTRTAQQSHPVQPEIDQAESITLSQPTDSDKPFSQTKTSRPVFQSLLPFLNRKKHRPSYKSDSIGFSKADQLEKEVPVTNPVEKGIRRLLGRYPVDKKVVSQTTLTEQYTYSEMDQIYSQVKDSLEKHRQSMRFSAQTLRPEEFFSSLKEAEVTIQEVYDSLQAHSFLVMKETNIVEEYHHFFNSKDQFVKQFIHKHFSDCFSRASESGSESDRRVQLKAEYEQLSLYFEDLPETALKSIQSIWDSVLSD